MKYFIILFLAVFLGCGEKVHIINSTSQEWVGGLQESGYGVDYKISIKVKSGSEKLEFEGLWAGDQYMKVRVIPDPANSGSSSFKKGDTILLKAGVTFHSVAGGLTKADAGDPPPAKINFKGDGLLIYTSNGKKKSVEITDFKKLEKIIYP